jgi:hypothetical protein
MSSLRGRGGAAHLKLACAALLAACSSIAGPGDRGEESTSAALTGDDAGDAGAPTRPARDWCRHPVVREVDGAGEIWALSDIHADYNALTTLLAGANLIAPAPASPWLVSWTGGSSTLVVVGDSIDRGPDAVDVLRLLMVLQFSAEFAGGRVIVTMGNHEAEFLANPDNVAAIDGSVGIDPELVEAGYSVDATAEGKDSIGWFMRNLPIAARVDDWFFLHAGDTKGQTIADITSAVQSGVDAAGFGAPVLSASTSILEMKFATSRWWEGTGDPISLLTTWTQALGVQHLVMGHQPQAVAILGGTNRPQDAMAAEYGGLLFFIDTGMSVGVDHTGGALLHVTDVNSPAEAWTEVMPDGSVRSL